MKKTKKTAKKPVENKVLSISSQQTEDKASIQSSGQTVKKAPIKSSQQADKKTLLKSSKQIKEETPVKSAPKIDKEAMLKSSPKTSTKGIKKQFLKSKHVCKITFRLPKEAAPGARSVSIVGDFNNWNVTESLMKKMNNGDFSLTMELPCSKEYSFRYLIDSERWENDWSADKYIPNEYGEDNSVVVV